MHKAAFTVLAAVLSCLTADAQSKIHLQGAWRVTELIRTGDKAGGNSNPQPGLFLFTAKHYSLAVVRSDQPRPELPSDPAKASAGELNAVYDSFGANSGTYEISGDRLIFHPIVAQNPAGMRPGHVLTYLMKLEGKTLSLSEVNIRRYPFTYRLTRVE